PRFAAALTRPVSRELTQDRSVSRGRGCATVLQHTWSGRARIGSRRLSASSLPQPSGDPDPVLAISLAELRLEPALFPRHDQEYHYGQDHEPEQNGEAAEEGRPAEPERQFSNIHRVARVGVGPGGH